jgi:hypothetical protein
MAQVKSLRHAGVRIVGDGKTFTAKFAGSGDKEKCSSWVEFDEKGKPATSAQALINFIQLPKAMDHVAAAKYCLAHKAQMTSGPFGQPILAKIIMTALKDKVNPPKIAIARKTKAIKTTKGVRKARKTVRKHK